MVNLYNDLIKNGKVQILEHKAVIENLLQSGYSKKSIYDVLVKKHHLNIKYRQFLNLVNQEIILTSSSRLNHTKLLLKSSVRQKPFNNNSSKIIAPTTTLPLSEDDLRQEIYDAVKGDYDQSAWAKVDDD